MRIVPALLSSVIVCGLLAIRMATAADGPPAWAYTPNNPDYKPPVDDGKPVRVPDSTAGYTWSQLRDRFIAPVWHPSDHGALPEIVANGRKPGVFACGFCHRATGPGGPENADLAGLPKSYIAVAAETTRGWRIAKDKQSHRIDVVVALAMAALSA